MTNRLFFIINPVAGSGKAKKLWPIVAQRLKNEGYDFDFVETKCKGDAIQITQKATRKNYKCYIAVGGDGTFHEMINGLMEANLSILPTAFLLPIGSGNDFVRQHNIPKWGEEWLQILQHFKTKKHNVGQVTYYENEKKKSRFFVNVAGLFYDGYIVRATTLRKKPISSSFQYLLLILKYLFKYRPPKGLITWPQGEMSGAFYTTNVGIARFSGGGMRFVPHADPFGDQFAVTIAKKMHPIRVLFSTHYFYNGKVARHSKITCFKTESIAIVPINEEEIHVETDGEYLGIAPCTFDLTKGGFLLVGGN